MTQDTPTAPEAAKGSEDDSQTKRRKAYGEATTALREQHRQDFESLYEAACKKHGVPYQRRLSDEEKARVQIEELLAEHPGLREQFSTT